MTLAITGKVWVFGDDLNTDAMYPAFAMKMDPPEADKHIFYEVRPGWTDQVSAGDIVLAGKNFGLRSLAPGRCAVHRTWCCRANRRGIQLAVLPKRRQRGTTRDDHSRRHHGVQRGRHRQLRSHVRRLA